MQVASANTPPEYGGKMSQVFVDGYVARCSLVLPLLGVLSASSTFDEGVDVYRRDVLANRITANLKEPFVSGCVQVASVGRDVSFRLKKGLHHHRESQGSGGAERVEVAVELLSVSLSVPAGRKETGSTFVAWEAILNHPRCSCVTRFVAFSDVGLSYHGYG